MIYRRQWTQPSGCGTVGDSRLFLNYFFPFYLPLGVLLFLFCARIFKLSPLKLGFSQEGAEVRPGNAWTLDLDPHSRFMRFRLGAELVPALRCAATLACRSAPTLFIVSILVLESIGYPDGASSKSPF